MSKSVLGNINLPPTLDPLITRLYDLFRRVDRELSKDYPYRDGNVKAIASESTFRVFRPDGVEIDNTSPSGGFNEGLVYANDNNFNFIVEGRNTLNLGETLRIPAAQNFFVDLRGVLLNNAGALPAGNPLVEIDSQINCAIFLGTLVYSLGGAVLLLKPTNNAPVDLIKTIADTKIWASSLGRNNGVGLVAGSVGLKFDTTNGTITWNEIECAQIGGLASNIQTVNTSSVAYNKIRVTHSQGAGTYHLDAGTSCVDNEWNLGIDGESVASVTGVRTAATRDRIFISSANCTTDLNLRAEAQNILVLANQSLTISDNASVKNNRIECAVETFKNPWSPKAAVHRNGTDQTGIVTATWTKVQWTTEVYDDSSRFDNATNYRWTPARIGRANIMSRVGWGSIVSGSILGISIYRNGTAYRTHYALANSGAGGGTWGVTIAAQVEVSAATDYFEIYAYHEAGSNQDLSGLVVSTWASFEMMP